MTRTLKSLGLLVGVLLALGGLLAQAAGAHVPARFTSEQNVTTLRGVHDPGTSSTTFTVTGNNVTCNTEEFHGTQVGVQVEDWTLLLIWRECTAFGFVGAKVTGLGLYPEVEGEGPFCHITIHSSGFFSIICALGKDITIDAGTCIAHVPAQSIAGTIEFTTGTRNVKHDLTLDVNLSGITTTHTDGFACPLPSGGESSTATLVGKWTLWGQDPETGAAVGITWDSTTA
jgi:hypothetical protein